MEHEGILWFNQLKPGQVMKELSVSRDPSVVEVVHPEVCNSYSAASLRESYQLRRKKIPFTTYDASESLDMKKLVGFCCCFVTGFGFFSLGQIEDKCQWQTCF